MAKRTNTVTRFIEDVLDDSKGFVDDLLDRAKDVETNLKDTMTDAVDEDSASSSDVASLQAALAELTAKVDQLAKLQLAGANA